MHNQKDFIPDAEAISHTLLASARSISDVLLLNQTDRLSFPLTDAYVFLNQLMSRAATLRGMIEAEEEKRRAAARAYATDRYATHYGPQAVHQC